MISKCKSLSHVHFYMGVVLFITLSSCQSDKAGSSGISEIQPVLGDTIVFNLDYAPYHQPEFWQTKKGSYFVFYDTQTAKKLSLFDPTGKKVEEISIEKVVNQLPFDTRKILFVNKDTMGFCSSNKQRIFWVNWQGDVWDTTYIRPTGAKRPHYCLFTVGSSIILENKNNLVVEYSRDPVFNSEGLTEIERLTQYYRGYNQDSGYIRITNLWSNNSIKYSKLLPQFRFRLDSNYNTAKVGPKSIVKIDEEIYFYSPYACKLYREDGIEINLKDIKSDLNDERWIKSQTIKELISHPMSLSDELNNNYGIFSVQEIKRKDKILVTVKGPSDESNSYQSCTYILNHKFEVLYKFPCSYSLYTARTFEIDDEVYVQLKKKPFHSFNRTIKYVQVKNI